jgi:hypothetical protein
MKNKIGHFIINHSKWLLKINRNFAYKVRAIGVKLCQEEIDAYWSDLNVGYVDKGESNNEH